MNIRAYLEASKKSPGNGFKYIDEQTELMKKSSTKHPEPPKPPPKPKPKPKAKPKPHPPPESESESESKPEPIVKKSKYTGKAYRENTLKKKGYATILQGKSDIIRDDGKSEVKTVMRMPEDLAPKLKKIVKTQIKKEIDDKLGTSGSGIHLDLSDDEDVKNYGKVVKHLVKHITDPKEPVDEEDYTQSKYFINQIEKKKRGRPRKHTN